MSGQWWICTDALSRGGEKILGRFESQELALEVRRHVEAGGLLGLRGRTLWVDSDTDASERTIALPPQPPEPCPPCTCSNARRAILIRNIRVSHKRSCDMQRWYFRRVAEQLAADYRRDTPHLCTRCGQWH